MILKDFIVNLNECKGFISHSLSFSIHKNHEDHTRLKESLFPLVCDSGNTHVVKENIIVAIKWSAQNKMMEIVSWALNKLVMLAKNKC